MRDMKRLQKMDDKKKMGLLADYNNGLSPVELITKYKISNGRIYQILREAEAMGQKVNFRVR